jgi:hypothetical protein
MKMKLKLLEILQWTGLLLGAGIWIVQHILGSGVTQAVCGAGGAHWGIQHDLWQALLMGFAAGFVLVAQAAAITVYSATREVDFGDGSPDEAHWNGELPMSRMHFFAAGAIVANTLFFFIILLDGFASIFNVTCRQG